MNFLLLDVSKRDEMRLLETDLRVGCHTIAAEFPVGTIGFEPIILLDGCCPHLKLIVADVCWSVKHIDLLFHIG